MDPPLQHMTTLLVQRLTVSRRSVSLEASVDSGATLQETAVAATSKTDTEKTVTRTVDIAAQADTTDTPSTPPPSAQPSSRYPTDVCWESAHCLEFIEDFAQCYHHTGDIKDPNGDDGRNFLTQRCLCIDRPANTDLYTK
jgi:hypothetical protein